MKKKNIFIVLLLFIVLTLTACTSEFQISLGFKVLEMHVGETLVLTTNIGTNSGEVEWKSSKPSIVSVDENGQIYALAEGSSDIIATYGEYESLIMVMVHEREIEYKPNLRITGPQLVYIDKTITLNVEGHVYSSYDTIVWTSSDDNIAEVTNEGVVSGIKPGLVNIRASLSNDPSVYADYSVLVKIGSGVQDVIYNYIYNYSYNVSGDLDLSSLNNKLTSSVEKVKDGIIGVSNYYGTSLSGIGTGVIYKKEKVGDKYLYTMLTNYHVIEEATSVKAYIGNELDIEIPANIIKSDDSLDLAIVSFEYEEELPVIEFGETGSYKAGDFIFAIGNPTGYDYYNSVTFGVISYEKRVMEGEKSVFIQHDAAINPGNSGGPLLNLDGQIIGINTLKIASTTIEGMGFAIDLETVFGFLGIE